MANKKISQLNSVDPSVGIGPESVFPMVSGTSSSNYQTSKVTSVDIAKFVLNPIPVGQPGMESIGFTGNSNIYFKKTNWDNASTNVAVNPYLQVNLSDGRLITGSGVAVPAALGDQMGNCTATEDLKMQGYDIIRANEIYFGGTSADDYAVIDYSYYAGSPQLTVLKIRSDDLTLSGTRHVSISGQALDLASTPISGNVTITGGDLEIDPGNKLIVNEINTYTMADGDDPAILSISGSARFFTWETDAPVGVSGNVDWKDSNVQFDSTNSVINYYFKNVRDGQTMTMYVQNTHSSTSFTPTFTNESDWANGGLGGNDYYAPPVPVLWSFPTGDTVAAMKEPPLLAAGTTNVYTFVNIKTGIFAAAITGYVY
jgi:hypothetical protein